MEKKTGISNFVIPKKPRLDPPKQPPPSVYVPVPEKFELKDATKEEITTLTTHFSRNRAGERESLSEKGWKSVDLISARLIQNTKLENKFNAYKKRMGLSEEFWGYRVVHEEEEGVRIAKEGLRTSLDAIADIGDPARGVVVYNSPALAHADRLIYEDILIRIVMFRTVRGKAKECSLGSGKVIPTKKYNCHIPIKLSSESNDFNQLALEHQLGAVYHYEFIPGTENMSKVPSMVLPHAIITFKRRETTTPREKISETKINTLLRQFQIVGSDRHTFILNGKQYKTTVCLPSTRRECPHIMINHCAKPIVQCIDDFQKYPILKPLRTTLFGKLLTSESVTLSGQNQERSSVIYLLLQTYPGLTKTLRRLGRFLVWNHLRWTVFYFPSGNVASEFGFPYKHDILYALIFCRNISNGGHNQLIGTVVPDFNWMLPDYFTTYDEKFNRKEYRRGLALPIHPSLLKKPTRGILRPHGKISNGKGKVKFIEEPQIREIERLKGLPDQNMSFEDKRKKAEQRMTPQQLKESEGTNALFRGAMVLNQEGRRGSEEKDQLPLIPPLMPPPNVRNIPPNAPPNRNPNVTRNPPQNISEANRQQLLFPHQNRNSVENTSSPRPSFLNQPEVSVTIHPNTGEPWRPRVEAFSSGVPPPNARVPPIPSGVPPPDSRVPPPDSRAQLPDLRVPLQASGVAYKNSNGPPTGFPPRFPGPPRPDSGARPPTGVPLPLTRAPPLLSGALPPMSRVPHPSGVSLQATGGPPSVSGVPPPQFPFRPVSSQPVDPRLPHLSMLSSKPPSGPPSLMDFSLPPPPFGPLNIPPPTILPAVSLSSKTSTSWSAKSSIEEEIGEAPMDVSLDEKEEMDAEEITQKEEQGHEDKVENVGQRLDENDEFKSDGVDEPAERVEENEFLIMALTPAAKPHVDDVMKPSTSTSAELLASTLSSLTPSGYNMVMLLKEKKMLEAAARPPPVEDTDLRVSAPAAITFSIHKPKPPSAAMANVLGEDDDDNEKYESSAPSSQDIDYRRPIESVAKNCFAQEFPKDRDDRLKDIDERCSQIPLPPGLSDEEKRLKKVTDHLQGKLRATQKSRENIVQSNYNMFMYQSFIAPDLCQYKVGPEGLTRSDSSDVPLQHEQKPCQVPEPESEQIRSPSPIVLAEPDGDAYLPKTFLNQQKCVIVPTEPKDGYEMYRREGVNSNRNAEKSPKKQSKKPIDYDKVRENQSDDNAKKSWAKLVTNRRINSRNEVEDGEIDSEEEKNASKTSDTSTSGSSDAAASMDTDLSFPPGITHRHGNNFRGRPEHHNQIPRHFQPYTGYTRPMSHNGRGRGRGFFNNRNQSDRYYGPKNFDFLHTLPPVIDSSAQNYSIFIDPNLTPDIYKQADLTMLFSEISKLKKLKSAGVRYHCTVYVHSRVYGMMLDNTQKCSKFFHSFNEFKSNNHKVVEVLPQHFCDASNTRLSDLAECMCKVNEWKGGVGAFFLSHSVKRDSDDARTLTARGLRLVTIRELFNIFRDWNTN